MVAYVIKAISKTKLEDLVIKAHEANDKGQCKRL